MYDHAVLEVEKEIPAKIPKSSGDALFSFQGRIRRSRFWTVQLVLFALNVGLLIVWAMSFDRRDPSANVILVVRWLFAIPTAWIALATYVKRWHDANLSAWMLLTLFVPIANILSAIICGILPGTEGTNKYGPDPRIRSAGTHEGHHAYAPASKTTCDQCGNSFPSSFYLEKSQDSRYLCEQCRAGLVV